MMWAFDIETDAATPVPDGHVAGLDPRVSTITSIGIASSRGDMRVRYAADERGLLEAFRHWVQYEVGVHDEIVTWNGGAFDWPYIAHRMRCHDMAVFGFTMSPWGPDRPPKYDPLPTTDGVQRINLERGRHFDVAWAYRRWAHDRGCRWSLKTVAEAQGIEPRAPGRGSDVASMDPYATAIYNLSDAAITLELAARCTTGLRRHLAD